MTFRTKKIRQKPPIKPLKTAKHVVGHGMRTLGKVNRKQWSYLIGGILVFMGVFVVWNVTLAMYRFITELDPKEIIFAAGEELQKDANGYTNILLLGDGGHVRDGADLIDTIMVASIDYEKNAVSLLSIPRDYYVRSGVQWPGRINELYRNHKFQLSEEERYDLFRQVVGDIVNLDIQYYLRVDFNAFVEVVDSIGGVTVDVAEAIYDPYYPNESDDGYTLFEISTGPQEMDGETALKFVRSRKTTSDFDRSARQQQVLTAIQAKALSAEVLTSPSALKGIYDTVQENINTDMTLREMIALGSFGTHFDRGHMVAKVIHDDPGQDGGFLYTPERKYYDGQFVLVPFGDSLELIHKYADNIFHHREAFYDPPVIEVLNATKFPGIARNAAYQLNRFGFNIQSIGNYSGSDEEREYLGESVIFYHEWQEDEEGNITTPYQATLDTLEGFVKGAVASGDKGAEAEVDISIVLGDDYDVFLVK